VEAYPKRALSRREKNIVDPFFLEGSRQLKRFWASLAIQGAEQDGRTFFKWELHAWISVCFSVKI
jgi:hypothetical protein